mmetsp:Transcript_6502/g.16133  ORF Transcript_6502/g.16133 Transcript_6502/m.16133 type:complete len:622 (-) Transcript_6502:804-2669(-)
MAEQGRPQTIEIKRVRYDILGTCPLPAGYSKLIVGMGKGIRIVVAFGSDRSSAIRFYIQMRGGADGQPVGEDEEKEEEATSATFIGEDGEWQCAAGSPAGALHAVFQRCNETMGVTNEFVTVTYVVEKDGRHQCKIQGFIAKGPGGPDARRERVQWNEMGSGVCDLPVGDGEGIGLFHTDSGGVRKAVLLSANENDEIRECCSLEYLPDCLAGDPIRRRHGRRADQKVSNQIRVERNGEDMEVRENDDPRYSSFYWLSANKKIAIAVMEGGGEEKASSQIVIAKKSDVQDHQISALQLPSLPGGGELPQREIDHHFGGGEHGQGGDGGGQGGGGQEGGGGGGEGGRQGAAPRERSADEGETRVSEDELSDVMESQWGHEQKKKEKLAGSKEVYSSSEPRSKELPTVFRVNTLGHKHIEFFNGLSKNFEPSLIDPLPESNAVDDSAIIKALDCTDSPFKSLLVRFENAVKYLDVICYRRAKNPLQALLNLDDGDKICSEFRQKVRPTWYCRAWRDLDQAVRTCEIQRMELVNGCRYGLSFIEEEAAFVTDDEKEAAGDAWRYLEGNVRLPIVDNEKGKDLLETLFETAEMYAEDALEQPGESETKSQAERFLSFMKTFSVRL